MDAMAVEDWGTWFAASGLLRGMLPPGFPKIICLCGSTRFYKEFQQTNYKETMAGNIVLSVGFYPHAHEQAHGEKHGCTSEQKVALDELHLRKIDLADEVLVLNVGGYIGESTGREIAYAKWLGKKISYLEPGSVERGECKEGNVVTRN